MTKKELQKMELLLSLSRCVQRKKNYEFKKALLLAKYNALIKAENSRIDNITNEITNNNV